MGLRVDSLADLPEQVRQQVGGKIAAQTANKYHNRKIEINGIRFDSRKEAKRYVQLMHAMRVGAIRDLRLQVDFTLQEAYTDWHGNRIRAIRYRADFTYQLTGTSRPAYLQRTESCGDDISNRAKKPSWRM